MKIRIWLLQFVFFYVILSLKGVEKVTREEFLKSLIKEQYGNMKDFAKTIDMPYTTLATILSRGIDGASFSNMMKICQTLNIQPNKLCDVLGAASDHVIDTQTLIARDDVRSEISETLGINMSEIKKTLNSIETVCHSLGLSLDDLAKYSKLPPTRFNAVNALLNEIGYNLGLTDNSNQYRLYAVDSSLSDVDVILTMEEFDELMNTTTDILGYTVDKIIKSKSK